MSHVEETQMPEVEGQGDSTQPPQKRSRKRWVLIGVGGLIFICICLIGLVAVTGGGEDQAEATEPAAVVGDTEEEEVEVEEMAVAESAEVSPDVPESTATPAPTNTPIPTDTPEPTATPDTNLVKRGTHLVGTDIQPGLYRGEAGTGFFGLCYWERLSNLTGELGAILANGNGVGQFYVEVLEGDLALQTACELQLLDPLPEPLETFPTSIEAGDYLVGIDIQPGRYRGETEELCYWERVSGFSGGIITILANENGVGQFFVQIQPGDFGLSTACELELVE